MSGQMSRIFCAVAVMSMLAMVSSASADPWHVKQWTGSVWVGSDKAQLASLGPATDVPGGATVMTGEDARLFLVRGTQTMLIGPNTVVTLPDSDSKGITTVLEQAGEVTFDVDHQEVKHFAVETPYLAAVVKGTNFTVRVDDQVGTVAVNRGLVEVQNLKTGDSVDTPVGQTAEVNGRSGRLTVSGPGPRAVIQSGNPRDPLVKGLSRDAVHALQVVALRNAGGSATGLTPVTSAQNDGIGSAVIAAAGQNGPGGGDPGNDAGGSGGNRGGSIVAPPSSSPPKAERNFLEAWFSGQDGGVLSSQVLVGIFGLSIALAFGLAYFKGKFG